MLFIDCRLVYDTMAFMQHQHLVLLLSMMPTACSQSAPRCGLHRLHCPAAATQQPDDDGSGSSDDEDGGAAQQLLASSTRLVSNRGRQLQPNNIYALRCKDANQQDPSNAVVRSVQFHPSGELLLSAGMDKALRFFQVLSEVLLFA